MADVTLRVRYCVRHPEGKEEGVADHLASHPLPDYEPMQTNLPDEAILFSVGEEED